MSKYRILGVNDEVTTCECCGKKNLKLTVVLTDGEREVHYGRDCAAKAVRPYITARGNLTSLTSALKIQRWAEEAEYHRKSEVLQRNCKSSFCGCKHNYNK